MTHEPLAAGAALNSADIDVGGTFTDAVLTLDGQALDRQGADHPVRPVGVLRQRDRGGRGPGRARTWSRCCRGWT